jgi:hypothetical protein
MAGQMLKTTSVIYDVVLGTGNPHASRYRHFCLHEWPGMEATLHIIGAENTALLPTVLPRIMRWVQIRHARYFKDCIDHPHPPNLPDYRSLVDTVLDRSWHLLPAIPERYKIATRGIQQQQPVGRGEQTNDEANGPIEKKGEGRQGQNQGRPGPESQGVTDLGGRSAGVG